MVKAPIETCVCSRALTRHRPHQIVDLLLGAFLLLEIATSIASNSPVLTLGTRGSASLRASVAGRRAGEDRPWGRAVPFTRKRRVNKRRAQQLLAELRLSID
jgi:hypothetical protein